MLAYSELTCQSQPLGQINDGFAALKSGAPVRQLIDYGA
jgi:Zn-dependent alcohol dehydrogenase